MSKYYVFILLFLVSLTITAQVGIGTTTPSEASMLEVSSSTDGTNFKGLMPPRVTSTANRDAIAATTADIGLLIFLADDATGDYCLQIWSGAAWENVYCLSAPVIGSTVFFSNASQSLAENAGGVDFDFTIDNPSPSNTISIDISANDYTELDESVAQTVVIPANVTSYTATGVFNITNDSDVESADLVDFTISSISGGLGTPSIGASNTHTLTIVDDDGSSALPFQESFETDGAGVRYTLSATQGIDASADDYFSRAQLSDFPYTGNNAVSFSGTNDGTYFFAAQDTDGVPGIGTGPQTMFFTGIDITGGINLELDVLLAEDDDAANEDWDSVDRVVFQYQIDSGGFQDLLAVRSTGTTNTVPAIDSDFDGVGDGTNITETWANFNAAITGTGSTLDLRIIFNLQADDEDIGIDNIRITSN